MGKKDKEKMAKEREKFIRGLRRDQRHRREESRTRFSICSKNSPATASTRATAPPTAWISYQTAYLKANYPVEFMAAVLSNEINNTDKISIFVAECKRMGIAILPPDVNRSALKFAPEVAEFAPNAAAEKEAIRFGLAGVKNVGEAAMQAAIEEREKGGAFKSLEDFCSRLDPRRINKKVLESLVKCGAFDFTGIDRAGLFESIDSALSTAASSHRDKEAGQVSLFDATHSPPPVRRRSSRAAVVGR